MTNKENKKIEEIVDKIDKRMKKGEDGPYCCGSGTFMNPLDKRIIREELTKAIQEAKQETERAYGGCRKCYGKGYATVKDYTTASPDFVGDKGFIKENDIMRFCDCERGKQLKSLLNYDKN